MRSKNAACTFSLASNNSTHINKFWAVAFIMSAHKRLIKEFGELKKENDLNIDLIANEENLYQWKGKIKGPFGTPYQNGLFKILIKVSSTYPFTPPEIIFTSRIFHPNINPGSGEICIDILKQNWTPAWTLFNACRAILVLLSNPEPNSPLNCDAGNLLRNRDNRGFSSLSKLFSQD
mmetsp:Transcript_43473/g.103354  ORF Transcript_43473/g.103354 Transcript_43473/m.103354 type:complete len:177 (+) Transcript_43473:950-1480(+)